jgi:predicted O-methyltransferase YrrM
MFARIKLTTAPFAARHPMAALGQVAGLLAFPKTLAGYLNVPESKVSLWRRDLANSHLPEILLRRRKDAPFPPSAPRAFGGAVSAYNEALYLLMRSLNPEKVVETGVAWGFSSSYLLQALHDNDRGQLVSIDLPSLTPKQRQDADGKGVHVYVPSEELTGYIIPPELRSRWRLILGDSHVELPPLLEGWHPIDAFFHDSDHSAQTMTWEYQTAWPHIRPNGLLLSDDISRNKAFSTFAREVGGPTLRWFGGRSKCGAIRKTPRDSDHPPPSVGS